MMQGISGTGSMMGGSRSMMSNTGNMQRNYGILVMRGNLQTKQTLKADNNTVTQQNNQPSELLKVVEGNKIDIRI